MRPRGVTFSGPQPPRNLDSGISHEESGRSTADEPTKITMRTRVAVRDKNPHRFQVVPLRDASKIQASRSRSDPARPLKVSAPMNYFPRSPAGTLSPCSPAKPLRSSLSAQSLAGNSRKENCYPQEVFDLNVNKTFTPSEPKALIAPSSLLSSVSLHDQNNTSALWEIDVNQTTARSSDRDSDFLRLWPKGTHCRVLETRNSSSRDQFKGSGDPSVHGRTATRSLHIRSHYDKSHARSTSLSNFRNLHTTRDSILATATTTIVHQNSDCMTEGKYTPGDLKKSWLLSPETHGLVKKSLSKKRHAIYTASLILPDFEKLAYSMGDTNSQRTLDSSSADESEQNTLRSPLQPSSGYLTRSLPPECKEKVSHLDMQVTSESTVRNQVEADTRASGDSLRDEDCNPRNSSASLSSSSTLTDAKYASLQAGFDANAGNIIYPHIILDLLVQIHQAIGEWS